ncbi:hypothetical protein [Selenomonas ruminantium]|uniref:Uncharacterized protein n=1 Tax=Selenomonas ruminantium TaxID=971 RepID=A0A1K1NLM7_SELRU|nr:hypothetical protein [Selenomonas ruminantium]SFW36177.1 hypothetical protein SAMN02910323_1474 [Selenomonas ruminantium]
MYEIVCSDKDEGRVENGKELLWPVLMYNIDVSVPSGSLDMNIFEQVILNLIQLSGYVSEKELAEDTCLDPDTVRFLVNRLRSKGWLDANHQLADVSKKKTGLEGTHAIVCVFFDLLSGEFLPELLSEDKLERYQFNGRGPQVRYTYGYSQGRSYERTAYLLLPPEQVKQRMLQPSEIQDLLEGYRRQWTPGSHYETAQRGELVFLRTYLCRSLSSGSYLLKNPLGRGYSPQMYAGLLGLEENSTENWQRIQDLRQQLAANTEQDLELQHEEKVHVEGFGPELRRFPGIRGWLLAIQKAERELSLQWGDSATEQAVKASRADICKYVYAGIEETLHILAGRYDLYSWSRRLLAVSSGCRIDYLCSSLHRLGISCPKQSKAMNLLKCSKNDIDRYFREGSFSLPVMLVLNLAAADGDSMHPFHRLRRLGSRLLTEWAELKEVRDAAAHGAEVDWKPECLLAAAEKFRKFVLLMLPELRPGQQTDIGDGSESNKRQARLLRADSELRKAIGWKFMASLDRERLGRLQRAQCQMDALHEDSELFQDQALQVITEFAGLLQQGLEEALTVRQEKVLGAREVKASAEALLKNTGCLAAADSLPRALATVGEGYIINAQQQKHTTLGAAYLCWLGTGRRQVAELQVREQEKCHALFEIICYLLVHRGHGNMVRMPVEGRQELEKVWKDVLQGLLLLGENAFWPQANRMND